MQTTLKWFLASTLALVFVLMSCGRESISPQSARPFVSGAPVTTPPLGTPLSTGLPSLSPALSGLPYPAMTPGLSGLPFPQTTPGLTDLPFPQTSPALTALPNLTPALTPLP